MEPLRTTAELSDWQSRQLRRDGVRVARGIYAEPGADPAALVNRVRAALAAAPEGSMVTSVTAYALGGLPLPTAQERDATQRVHLAVPKAARSYPRRPGVTVHLFAADLRAHRFGSSGIPVADLRQCWVDATRQLGREAPWDRAATLLPIQRGRFNTPARRAWLQAVQLGDVLVRRQRPLATLAAFAAYVAALPRSPGLARVREAFSAIRAGTDSLPETQIRLALAEAGFPEPAINYEVVAAGRRRFLDICWPDQQIDLEYQGAGHFDDPRQVKADMERRGDLQRDGWVIVEASARDLADPGKLFARLAATLSW